MERPRIDKKRFRRLADRRRRGPDRVAAEPDEDDNADRPPRLPHRIRISQNAGWFR